MQASAIAQGRPDVLHPVFGGPSRDAETKYGVNELGITFVDRERRRDQIRNIDPRWQESSSKDLGRST